MLFATGVALLATGETHGTMVGLHKASFVVWVGAAGVHVLAHVLRLPRLLRERVPGLALRLAIVAGAIAVGVVVAVATLPERTACRIALRHTSVSTLGRPRARQERLAVTRTAGLMPQVPSVFGEDAFGRRAEAAARFFGTPKYIAGRPCW